MFLYLSHWSIAYVDTALQLQLQVFPWAGEGVRSTRIKIAVRLLYFMIPKFIGERKILIKYKVKYLPCVPLCTQEEKLYTHRRPYTHGRSLLEWKWKFLVFSACTHFILPSVFWFSILNERNCPILDKWQKSLYFR